MSDAEVYASRLGGKLSYTNTFFHRAPHLDITRIAESERGKCDFSISSDVFEHVAPPVQNGFDNLRKLLKPGGVVIFSVPFSVDPDTVEHFPDLHEYAVAQGEHGEWELRNKTASGESQVFRNLIFHGGPGSALEMRLSSRDALLRHFQAAGFSETRVHDQANFEFGICWLWPWSVTMSAVAPR